MSKLAFSLRLVLSCSLAVVGLAAAGAAPALALEEEGATLGYLPFRSPSIKVCKDVPNSGPTGVYKGLFSDSHCLVNTEKGLYAWATPGHGGTWYCLLAPTATKLYTTDLCQAHNTGAGAFLALWGPQVFPRLIGLLDASTLTGKVAGDSAEIACKHGKSEVQPETGSLAGGGRILYTGCESIKPTVCLVSSENLKKPGEIETEPVMATATSASLNTFSPETGTTFVTLEFTNKSSSETCGVGSPTTAGVTGSQMCTYVGNIEEPAEEHNLFCKGSESKLELGGNAAKYEGLVLSYVEGHLLFKFI